MHHPERVFRQFGMVQDIPPNPLISERRLHTIDRRGRHGEDWAVFHRDYIVKWNDVQSMLVVRPEIVNGRGIVPDYMNWYHQITRVQISHNIGSTDITGYRPTDTRDWEYVYNRMQQLVLDCDNSGRYPVTRETRARNRAIGRDIMTFSSARYSSVRSGPADYAHNIHPETRRHLGISPVSFDGSDLNTPIEEPQDIHPRRNRRRPRCGTGGHY
ncbi:UNVERIFIED_CONTAM: hypothetical protein Sangu_3201300 [Sesamum angustifolium]|uniref:Uncharacterized protein n=1 Tax=Sesamum angustifolium TaxID=2727405 RepID=A0AAW2JLK0_9LAMI